jgi:hypothetical protein
MYDKLQKGITDSVHWRILGLAASDSIMTDFILRDYTINSRYVLKSKGGFKKNLVKRSP